MSDSYKAPVIETTTAADTQGVTATAAAGAAAAVKAPTSLSAFPSVWDRVSATETATVTPGAVTETATATATATAAAATAATSVSKFTQTYETTVTETDLNNLEEASELAAECASLCCCLARTTRGAVRRICRCLYASCEASLAKLRTQIYIQTGTLYSPPVYTVPCTGGADTLRRLIATEQELQAVCQRGIEQTENPAISDVFAYCESCSRRRQTEEEALCACMLQ